MHAMLFYTSEQAELYHGRNMDAEYNRLAHRHRVELVHAYDEKRVQETWGRFSGSDFTEGFGLRGSRTPVWATSLSRGRFYGPGSDFDDRASAWSRERFMDDVSA